MSGRTFPTAAVVGVTTGILLGDVGAVHAVLDYALDDTLFTHQLPGAADAAVPGIVAQHPWLADLELKAGDRPALEASLAAIIAEHGETLTLEPVVGANWKRGNALTDLVDIAGDRPVIVVEMGDES